MEKYLDILDLKTKGLIGIGVDYAVNCKHCMDYHQKMAQEGVATIEEMWAAVAMGEKVRNGAQDHTIEAAEEVFCS